MPVSAASAPGKVLVAGGYLVLDRKYTGLVFGLDARIHVVVQGDGHGDDVWSVSVKSPQFNQPPWQYSCRKGLSSAVEVEQIQSNAAQELSRNPFVETTLHYVFSYLSSAPVSKRFSSMNITILADNDYYSTGSVTNAQRFHHFGVPLSKANKTGLGSSAALVTALTASLLSHFLPTNDFDLSTDESKHILHNLAQAAHCAAQGKVGSGFDVASAVFGSCLYRRFSPEILSSLPDPDSTDFSTRLRQVVNQDDDFKWDTEIRKDQVTMPNGLRMVMCDVSCGSQTPGMVKKVLAWRAANAELALKIWSDLDAANLGLAKALQQTAQSSENNTSDLTAALAAIRRQIQIMSKESDVPIEPPAQTRLIDACCAVPGVIGGTVPGAGGYDAVVLLIEDKKVVVDELEKLFKTWKFDSEDGGQGKVSMLGVREELDGARHENAQSYQQWL